MEDRRPLAADFNGDETVDEFDLRNWQAGYGTVQAAPAQGDADGDGDVDGRDFLQFQREFGPTQNNLIPYRPQSVQDEGNPTGAPIYKPFPKRPVSALDEAHNALGPGIRINRDDDNQNGTADALEQIAVIPLENDLIEVKIERMAGTGDLVLAIGNRLRVYYDHEKSSPVVAPGGTSEVLSFTNNRLTVFVEWIDSNHGTETLSLVEPGTATTHDTVRFHSFRSLTVVFGGRGQDPEDTDKDGSIGDSSGGDPGNREGIFDIAQGLYNQGWDVMAFDEADYTLLAESVAEREIKNAIDNRFVTLDPVNPGGGVSIMGYSQGGGVVHDMIERELDPFNNTQYTPAFVVYLDAVQHDSFLAETDWPGVVFDFLNIYETRVESPIPLGGGPIVLQDPNDAGFFFEEINVTTSFDFNNNLDHFDIDDDFDVQLRIFEGQEQVLVR